MTAANWTPDQIAEASAAEIAAGRLPLRAQWRIAEQRARRDAGEPGSFTSDLTIEEFGAIRSVGFSPVGQVMGSAVYNMGWSYSGCGYFGVGGGYITRRVPPGFGGPWGSGGGYAMAPVMPVPATQQLLEQARHRAVERMRAECAGLGGDGVVGVRLALSSFYGNGLEFFAIGTAVRADGTKRPRRPFTSDLSGQDFAKLLRAGWVPVELVQGVGAVIRHDDWATAMQQRSWYNQEIAGTTQLVSAARDGARQSLLADAKRSGATTVILRDTVLRVRGTRCTSGSEGEDHVADAFMWGTAIVPIDPSGARPRAPERPGIMLRLDQTTKGSSR